MAGSNLPENTATRSKFGPSDPDKGGLTGGLLKPPLTQPLNPQELNPKRGYGGLLLISPKLIFPSSSPSYTTPSFSLFTLSLSLYQKLLKPPYPPIRVKFRVPNALSAGGFLNKTPKYPTQNGNVF